MQGRVPASTPRGGVARPWAWSPCGPARTSSILLSPPSRVSRQAACGVGPAFTCVRNDARSRPGRSGGPGSCCSSCLRRPSASGWQANAQSRNLLVATVPRPWRVGRGELWRLLAPASLAYPHLSRSAVFGPSRRCPKPHLGCRVRDVTGGRAPARAPARAPGPGGPTITKTFP